MPPKAKAESYSYHKIKVSWNAAPGASAYEVYRTGGKGGNDTKVYTTSADKTTYINTGRICGKRYAYKVRAYQIKSGKKIYSRFSKVTSTFARPEKVKNVKAKERMSSLFQIDWNKSDGASGYQLQVKPASTGKWSNYYQKADGTKFYPINYLDRYNEKRYTKHTTARWDMTPEETQYQFRVHAYRVVNGMGYIPILLPSPGGIIITFAKEILTLITG